MITILNIDKFIKENKLKGPVETSQVFFGKSNNFHPSGLYSEDIFGISGSKERKESFSYINLNCNVIHPIIYDMLKKTIERKIVDLLSADSKFTIDPTTKSLIEDENGKISGMTSLYENIKNIRFRRDEDKETFRNKIISMLELNIKKNTFFINKLLIIPPDFRPITIMEQFNETRIDELSTLYQKIIVLSRSLSTVSGVLYDVLSYRMQLLMNELYELIRDKVSRKMGLIREMILGKRVDFSARAVIVPNKELYPTVIGVPLRLCCLLFEPFLIYGLLNSTNARNIPPEFFTKVKEFLGKEKTIGIEI